MWSQTSAAEDKVFAIYTMDDIIKRKNSGQDGSDMLPCESANIILSAPSPMHVRMAREVNEVSSWISTLSPARSLPCSVSVSAVRQSTRHILPSLASALVNPCVRVLTLPFIMLPAYQ